MGQNFGIREQNDRQGLEHNLSRPTLNTPTSTSKSVHDGVLTSAPYQCTQAAEKFLYKFGPGLVPRPVYSSRCVLFLSSSNRNSLAGEQNKWDIIVDVYYKEEVEKVRLTLSWLCISAHVLHNREHYCIILMHTLKSAKCVTKCTTLGSSNFLCCQATCCWIEVTKLCDYYVVIFCNYVALNQNVMLRYTILIGNSTSTLNCICLSTTSSMLQTA